MSETEPTVHDFSATTIEGGARSLSDYAGKVLLIVNTASRCGFTPQYAGLAALHRRFQGRGFSVLAFPSNDFMGQEPGSDEEIRAFCMTRYATPFPLFSKIRVKGKGIHPLYRYLTRESAHPGPVSWNFNKFLIGPDGRVAARFGSRTVPESPDLVAAVERLLPV
jgi:glutathione peroxidase